MWQMLKATIGEFSANKVPQLGAALAYYTVFSLAPLLLIAIGIASAVFGEAAARAEVIGQIESTMGRPAAQAIQEMLDNTRSQGGSVVMTLVGIAILVFAATGVFVQLQDALNTIWRVHRKPGRGLWNFIRDRFLSFGVVLGTGFLLLTSLVISAGLEAVGKFVTPESVPGGTWIWIVINSLISFGIISLLFALIFKLLPDVRIAWRDVWIGAVGTALLFTIGKYLSGLYLGRSSTASAFGAAGSLAIVFVWVYYSSQIVLLGAAFTRVYALQQEAKIEPSNNAEFVEAPASSQAPRAAQPAFSK
jgi:membrane protein